MALDFLDIFILAILIISILMLATGNGETLLTLFSGKNSTFMNEYDKPKMLRATLFLCLALLAGELLMMFLKDVFPMIPFVSIAITICSFVIYTVYLKKYAGKK